MFDFLTTEYALHNNLGYEGNSFAAIFTGSMLLFLAMKTIGTLLIIGCYRIVIQKSEQIAKAGQCLIILMMIIVVGNNLFVISGYALPFSNITPSGTGAVGLGNNYFSNELLQFNLSYPANIYVLAEPSEINILEPQGFALGTSSSATLVTKGNNDLRYAMVGSDGYLYFVDGDGIKRKKTRDNTNPVNASDTGIFGSVLLIYTSPHVYTLQELNKKIYFLDQTSGSGTLKHFDLVNFIVESDFTTTVAYSTGFGVYKNSTGGIQMIVSYPTYDGCSPNCQVNARFYKVNDTSSVIIYTNPGGSLYISSSPIYGSLSFIQSNNYLIVRNTFGSPFYAYHEIVVYKNNFSVISTDTYMTGANNGTGNMALGANTIEGLYAKSNSLYDTFNFLESGTGNIPTLPSEINYNIATINSVYSTYYNSSKVYINYNIDFGTTIFTNFGLTVGNYRWKIDLIDPNNVVIASYISPQCTSNIISCHINETKIFQPLGYWQSGFWHANLYEYNINTFRSALLYTSQSWNILNASDSANASIANPPTTDLNSGQNPQTISTIDTWVLWLGLGLSDVSKLLFSLIVIGIFFIVGLSITKSGDIALTGSFIPYIFFTYISYIPKWIFIILIIMLIIRSRVFR